MMETLSSEEWEKAGRFHFAADRTRHIVGRALLRLLFGRLLGTAPASLRFSYNAFGKAGFPVDSLEHRMRFNISHAGDMILIGLSVDRAIGVDVERVRGDLDVEGIAHRFFSAREQVEWARLDTGARHDAFFRCWCRREAFAKAQGEGLFLPSDKFDVPLLPTSKRRCCWQRGRIQPSAICGCCKT
jgi:4'-phosphopantetheinyl transferase